MHKARAAKGEHKLGHLYKKKVMISRGLLKNANNWGVAIDKIT
jgi:hypothetical protein